MQLELFDKHLKDLSFKNKKLSSTLKEIQAEEESCERELNQLDKEKAELAQRLAEVTQTAHAKQKFIAQLCARRQTVVDSLAKMHQDAQEYQVLLTASKQYNMQRATRRRPSSRWASKRH